jgi:hypothetical protein
MLHLERDSEEAVCRCGISFAVAMSNWQCRDVEISVCRCREFLPRFQHRIPHRSCEVLDIRSHTSIFFRTNVTMMYTWSRYFPGWRFEHSGVWDGSCHILETRSSSFNIIKRRIPSRIERVTKGIPLVLELELKEPGIAALDNLAACYARATPPWTGPFDLRQLEDVDFVSA